MVEKEHGTDLDSVVFVLSAVQTNTQVPFLTTACVQTQFHLCTSHSREPNTIHSTLQTPLCQWYILELHMLCYLFYLSSTGLSENSRHVVTHKAGQNMRLLS